jgi:phage shock protein B
VPAVITAVFGLILLALAIMGGVVVAILRLIKGPQGKRAAQADEEEARMIQDLHKGLKRMESRIESLETILLEREGKEPSS